MHHHLRSFALLAGLVSVSNCGCDKELSRLPGDIAGVVCSVDTGAGLANVHVSVLDARKKTFDTLTGDDGTYRFTRVAAGDAIVTIQSPDGDRTVDVSVVSDDEVTLSDDGCHGPVDPPVPAGSITGCICDETSGAWLRDGNAYVTTPEGGIYSAITDDNGCFVIENVPPGEQLVTVERASFYATYAVVVSDGAAVSVPSATVCEAPPPPDDVGSVAGRVCAADGSTWLADADVYVIRADGTRATATTDADGRYTLTGVPAGEVEVHVEKGSFSATFTVTVTADQTITLSDSDCELLPPDLQIAVVQGQYDHVEDVLSSLGVTAANVTLYDGHFGGPDWVGELVENYATLSSYDVVFFNCGVDDRAWTQDGNQVAIDNLRQFVADGGSVYASDWAYDIVEKTWPDFVDFEASDANGDDAQRGLVASAVVGTITDASLAAAMGQPTVSMDYLLPQWAVMSAVANNVTVYVRGDARVCTTVFCGSPQTRTNVPHTIGFSPGAGRVLYTSFHQEPGVNADQERILQLLMFEL